MRFPTWQKIALGSSLAILWSLGLFILHDIRPDYQVVADVTQIRHVRSVEDPSIVVRDEHAIEIMPTLSEMVEPLTTRQIPDDSLQTSPCYPYQCFTGPEFISIYEQFEGDVLGDPVHKFVFNDEPVDQHIWEIAEDMGYQKRGFANESDLITFEGRRIQPEARDAYVRMRDAMLREGIPLHLVSAYRTSTDQRHILRSKIGPFDRDELLDGSLDQRIREVLKTSAIPGYSKHHSGFTVDFGCGNNYLVYTFSDTECYAWMSKGNFANTKKYGFIPSYPYDAQKQGPAPEPWEYVWVPQQYLQ